MAAPLHRVPPEQIPNSHLAGEASEVPQQLPLRLAPFHLPVEACQLRAEKGHGCLEEVCLWESCVLDLSCLLTQHQAMPVLSLQGQ